MACGGADLSDVLSGIKLDVSLSPVDASYKCRHCHNILREPVQAICGHRFCMACFTSITRTGPIECGTCRQDKLCNGPASILTTSTAFPDKATHREILTLRVQCDNQDCKWIGSMKDYQLDHETQCVYKRTTCAACRVSVARKDLPSHCKRECEERTVSCKHCKCTLNYKTREVHNTVCPKFPMRCDLCAKTRIARENFAEHCKRCSGNICSFCDVGCDFVGKNKEELLEHERTGTMQHLRQILPIVLSMSHRNSVRDREDEDVCMYRSAEAIRATSAAGDLDAKIVTLENVVCLLNREVERTSNLHEAYVRQSQLDKQHQDALQRRAAQLEHNVNTLFASTENYERLLGELHHRTVEGVLLWKVDSFRRRTADAKTFKRPYTLSPAFYSSRYGYKMCLRLYPNGDGSGKDTHLSLLLVIMKGEYDALQTWPFKLKVTLMILDQSGNRKHLTASFRPATTMEAFGRPRLDMNVASGCPRFCSLQTLTENGINNVYVQGDVLFIKAIVKP